MNTEILLWIEPLVMNHQRCSDKVYFKCVVDGNHTKKDNSELEDFISGKTMYSIMDFGNIDSNWNYGIVSSKTTNKPIAIEYSISPEKQKADKEVVDKKKKEEKAITKVVSSKKELKLTKDNVEVKDKGIIEVSLPELNIKQDIDFTKIWATIEKNFIGKIKEGDKVVLTDDDGNKIFEVWGGSFLNVGLADMSIYDKKTMPENRSLFNHTQGLKGGLFVREDGRMDIGDLKRTFFLQIYTNNLLKASLRLGKPMTELTQMKLLGEGDK